MGKFLLMVIDVKSGHKYDETPSLIDFIGDG